MLNQYIHRLKCDYLDNRSSLKGELERQIIHILTGVALILLIQAAGNMALAILLLLLVLYTTVSLVIIKGKLPLALSAYLCKWGRPSKQNIPLKGTIMLLCGATVSLILFPEEIVYASIAIVAFGDSIATIVGVLIGRHKLPYSDKKTVEGTGAGIITAFLASAFFVPPIEAFIGAAGGMLLESIIDLQTIQEVNSQMIFKLLLNDNFLIPIFSGLLIFIVGFFNI
jgi:dolichol kinase